MEISSDALQLMHLSSYGGSPTLCLKKLVEEQARDLAEIFGLPRDFLIPGKSSSAVEFTIRDAEMTRAFYEAFNLLPPLPVPSPGYLRRKAQEMARKRRAELRRRKR